MKNIRVAFVEDDTEARKIFASMVAEASGMECVGDFVSTETALEPVVKLAPDVVVCDVNLPGASGVECVRQLKLRLPTTQFMMLTVYDDSEYLFDALAAGACGYLLKRSADKELVPSIRAIYTGESPMSGSIARKVVQQFQRPAKPVMEGCKLTPREQSVLEHLAKGYLYKEIADLLKISVPTVNSHVRGVYEKMHVQSRAQAVAIYSKLIEPRH